MQSRERSLSQEYYFSLWKTKIGKKFEDKKIFSRIKVNASMFIKITPYFLLTVEAI